MMRFRAAISAFLVSAGLTAAALPAAAATNVVYILDASNSMWGQIDGTAKIETAREVMGDLLANVAEGTTVGLLAYGHRSEGACDDIEVLSGLGAETPEALLAKLNELKPKGKTPIAGALQAAAGVFPTNDANNNVILISDGIETCSGDPCAVAADLAKDGVDTKVHAVGFDVDDAAREQLECIAEKGNGSYYNAGNADELKVALAEVKEVVEAAPEPAPEPEPEPEPAEPTLSQFFFDGFDSELSEDWVVNNPNPDAFIVEDGNLLMINSTIAGFNSDTPQNLIVLKRDLPKGDWDAHFTFTGEFKTGKDNVTFGLFKDSANYLAGRFWSNAGCCGCSHAGVGIYKNSGGTITKFERPVIGNAIGCGAGMSAERLTSELTENETRPIRLSLHKRGRSYHVSFDRGEVAEDGTKIVVETDPLTSLRAPGEIAFLIGKWKQADGEVLVNIDSVEIVSVSE
ncbi:vWA domain-containing protein [Pyruvatibacter mobilis]|uniref:vWA domain-containing protein n=1 Tax=Pyruvatibacter mobilis TaxID=1712261 RepID=UPI003BB0B3DB